MGTTKIFVGNIRDGTTSESLRELFECYGRVTEADVLSGFGFVVSSLMLFHYFICKINNWVNHCDVSNTGILRTKEHKKMIKSNMLASQGLSHSDNVTCIENCRYACSMGAGPAFSACICQCAYRSVFTPALSGTSF